MTRVLCLAVLVCVVQCLPMSKDELEDFSNFLLKTSSLDLHVKSADPDYESDEEEVASDHAWEESGKFEGDLILNDRQRRLIVENVEGLSRNGLTDSTKRWPNNEVIYFIQNEHFNSGQVQAILAGIEDLERASCVKFRPYRKGDRDAVVIQGSRRGCFSQVGYQGGYQVLNLSGRHPIGRGCFRHGTVVHELLHSLGFYHMQSSPDRDDYIDVVWANIMQPARHNFRKYNSFSVSDFGVGYDYDSVLHYSRRAFSVNGQDTLVPKKSGAEIGQRVGLSDKDTQKLNKMYCDADNDAAIQADENTSKKTKAKKKKPKNHPFEGQGIGYHQGKTVVIKLPAVEIYKLPNIPSTRVFDFSRTPQIVSPQEEGYRFGEEITYLYKPANSLNIETSRGSIQPSVEILTENIEPHEVKKESLPKEDKVDHIAPHHLNELSKVKSDYVPIDGYDKDLQDAYERISKIVKENLYPHSKQYDYNNNKDYSKYHEAAQKNHIYGPSLPISPLTRLQKDTDITHGPIVSFKTANDDSKSLFQDRMDIISLPTKKPYSSYEQTETPRYATLEYLKNRHDYSDVYSYSPNYAQKDPKIFAKSDKNNEDIKINPYGLEFYTDYASKDKDQIIHTPLLENVSKQVKPEKYKLEDRPKYEQFDSSYALLPTKKPYSAFDQTETPEYASLKYLKNRHDISDDYQLKKLDLEKIYRRKSYKTLEEDRPDEEDWYKKNAYQRKPKNHGRDSYSDYAQNIHRSQDDLSDEYNDSDEVENSRDSLSNINAEYKIEEKDQHAPDIDREDKYLTSHAKFKNYEDVSSTGPAESKRNRDHNYDSYGRNQKDKFLIIPQKLYNYDNDGNSEELPSNLPVYIKDIISDHETQPLAKSIMEPSNKNSKDSPKRIQAYTQYGIPVPLSNGWYKVTYTVP